MYFPYLRARQFELITLRELVIEGVLQNKIMPVLEPVKEGTNNLDLAHKIFQENNFEAYLIVNPAIGKTPGDKEIYLNYISKIDHCKYVPAFIYCDNSNYIKNSIKKFKIKKCLVIGLSTFSDEDGFKKLCEMSEISHIMLLDPNKYRGLDRYIKKLGKYYIRLDDVFEKQQTNAHYLNITAHKFSEEHLYYTEENYQGFSDYTVLSSEFIDGGSTPRAVVIHLTYLNAHEQEQIWIRHFTSDTNDSIANVQGKFAEAARKAIRFCSDIRLNNSAMIELRKYYEEARYPGLGIVKKISIKNHLLIVSNYLK